MATLGGAVNTGTSPKVQYVYSEMGSGANHSRLNSVIYPNGRQINYVYTGGWDGALHDALSRVFQVVENANSQVLEQLGYLGVVTPVYRNHYNGVNQVFSKQSGESNGDAGDIYTGYDRFGRVAESRWRKDSNERVRIQYGHDRNGNRLYADNLINNDFDELYHADGAANGYDGLNRLVEYQQGPLSDTNSDGIPDTVSSGSAHTQSWGLDAQGNFSSLTTDGTTVNRTHNQQNEILTVGAASLTYDNNGNLTTDEQGQQLIFDAWNRLVEVQDNGSTTIQVYTYDALARRQTEDSGTQRDFYYSAAWQVLEERVGGAAKVQYIWSPVYVDALIERDRDADGNAGNGLEARGWALQDANYNVVALADVNGTVIERYSYDAYGQRFIWTGAWATRASSSYSFDVGYQGKRHDTTTGFIYFNTRWVSPTLGGPISEDWLGFAAGYTNLYVWIGNNPVNGLDPYGLQMLGNPTQQRPRSYSYPSYSQGTGGGYGSHGGGPGVSGQQAAQPPMPQVPVPGTPPPPPPPRPSIGPMTPFDVYMSEYRAQQQRDNEIYYLWMQWYLEGGWTPVGGPGGGGGSQCQARRAIGRGRTPPAPKGGEYGTVRSGNEGGQVHHTPAAKVTPYAYKNAPAVWMETADHYKTASWGSSKAAEAYRQKQADLISQGKLREAIQMDIHDIRAKFGTKYDANIKEMLKSFGFSE